MSSGFLVIRYELQAPLTPLEIPADFLKAVEWTSSRPSYRQAR
jgi:hypothetical protein